MKGVLAGRTAAKLGENHIRFMGVRFSARVSPRAHRYSFAELHSNFCYPAAKISEIESLIVKEAIQLVAHHSSENLPCPKKDGGSRPVINLRPLNHYIRYQHFKMEGIHVVRGSLQSGDWMC